MTFEADILVSSDDTQMDTLDDTQMDTFELLKRKHDEDVNQHILNISKSPKMNLESRERSQFIIDSGENSSPNLKKNNLEMDPVGSNLLKISFVDKKYNFSVVNWCDVSTFLTKISSEWKFLAFADRLKSVLISTSNQECINKFGLCKHIDLEEDSYEIVVSEVSSKSKKSIIYNAFTKPMNKEQLLSKLSNQGVTEVFKIEKLDVKSGEKYFTGSVILIFELDQIPEKVYIEGVSISVSMMSPRPMLCSHCGLIGHTSSYCNKKSTKYCKSCFNIHLEKDDCIFKCRNCNGQHSSLDKNCESIIKEIQILKIKDIHNISYNDAKAVLFKGQIDHIDSVIEEREIDRTNKLNEMMKKNNDLINTIKIVTLERDSAIIERDEAKEKIHFLETVTIQKLANELNQHINDIQSKMDELLNRQEEKFNEMMEGNRRDMIQFNENYKLVVEENKQLNENCKKLRDENSILKSEMNNYQTKSKNKHESEGRSTSKNRNITF